jgi:hypothetical protein
MAKNNIPIALDAPTGGPCGEGDGGCAAPGSSCGQEGVMFMPSGADPYVVACFATPCTDGFCPEYVCVNFSP